MRSEPEVLPSRATCRSVLGWMAMLLGLTSAVAGGPITSAPFSPPSRPNGPTLFSKLDEKLTGIVVRNPYDDPEMWGARYREFMGGAMGSGIAVGDFDHDGLPDIYVSTKTSPGRLYKNLGGWKFVDVTEKAGLASPPPGGFSLGLFGKDSKPVWNQGAVFVDVNNDGYLDLYICRTGAPNLLYINQKDGTFKEEAQKRGLGLVDASGEATFCDYDRDGWLDVYVQTNVLDSKAHPHGQPDHLFHNNGDGTFTEVTEKAGIAGETFGHSATWIDYDGDGWPDLYVANDYECPDFLYHNNHDGTFTNVIDSVVPHMPYSAMGSDLGDVNNDGLPDLFVADMGSTTSEKERRGLAYTKANVLGLTDSGTRAPQYMKNVLFLNTGRGNFQEAASWAGVAGTNWTWSVRLEDFDNDGWTDLFVTNGMIREASNSDLLTRMMRAESDDERIRVMKNSPPMPEEHLAFKNNQGLGFVSAGKSWGLDEEAVSFGCVTGDFDGDGDLDIVYLNADGGVSVFRNDVLDQHRIQVRLRGVKSNRFGIGAIVRIETRAGQQMRMLLTTRGYASGSEVVAHFGLGSETEVKKLTVEWPSGVCQQFQSLPADRAYTIEESGSDTQPPEKDDPLFLERTKDLGAAVANDYLHVTVDREQVFLPFRTDRRGPGVAAGDLAGGGHDDLFVGSTPTTSPKWLVWQDGKFVSRNWTGDTGVVEEGPPLIADFNGDGHNDLLITRASANNEKWPDAFVPELFLGDGHGTLTRSDLLPRVPVNVGAVCAADWHHDGALGIFLGARSIPGDYPETPHSVMLRWEAGRYIDVSDQYPEVAQVGLVKSAVFSDVDGDGWVDLIVATEWGYVKYLHNDGGKGFSDWTERAGFQSGGKGWWNSVVCGDFNGDGRPDFAVGNLGYNTQYHADAEHPVRLYYGDFAGNGTKLLAEGVYDGNTLVPTRTKLDLGGRIPAILRRFPTVNAFAKATMAEVYTQKKLDSAESFSADQLASGVFLSEPDGTYRFVPFPRQAQIGPVRGMVAADFDGDGIVDLCAVQNSDSAVPRFDGGVGLMLKGDGRGDFKVLSPRESGIDLTGTGCALVLVDPGEQGRTDLFATRQGRESALLESNQRSGVGKVIALQQPGLNADAVGARIRVEFSDGTSRQYETSLGSGWWSASAPVVRLTVAAKVKVTSIIVTWPDGATTHHVPDPAETVWKLTK